MSKTIDERIVEMRFDNKQFEANVATSMSTLEKLKKSLDLEGAAKGFDSLSDAASKCNVSALGQAAEAVSTKFSALETMAVGALLKIGSQAVTTGEQLLKSLTVDQVMEGWNKYGQKTESVQTIMNATGKSIEEVNEYLDKLMWYSDETSYSFTDMTSALATMVSSGGDIDSIIPMLMGVANATAYSGKGAAEFSAAMRQLVQSYSTGALKAQDWRVMEQWGATSAQLKEVIIQTGEYLGTIKKGEVTVANFTSSLSDGWATTEVLEKAYSSYASIMEEAYDLVQSGAFDTAGEAIASLTDKYDDYVVAAAESAQSAKSFTEAIEATKDAVSSGWMKTFEIIFGNYEEAKVLWSDLAEALWDAFASGGESRNDMLKEALSISGFDRFTSAIQEAGIEIDVFQEKLEEIADANGISLSSVIREYGSLEEAVQNGAVSTNLLWSAMLRCNEEIEDVDLSKLNGSFIELMSNVDELSGRQHLISAFWNTWEGIGALLSTIKDAFREIFPASTADQVYNFAKGLNELTERFKTFLTESEERQKLLTDLKNTFKGVFAVLDIVKQALSGLWRALAPVRSSVGGLLSGVLGLTGGFGEWLSNLDATIKKNDTFYKAFKKIVDFIQGAITTVKDFAAAIKEKLSLPSFKEIGEDVKAFLAVLKEKIGAPGLEFLRSLFENLSKRAKQLREAVSSMKNGVVDSVDKIDGAVSGSKIVQVLTNIGNLLAKIASAVANLFGKIFSGLIDMLSHADFKGVFDFINTLIAGELVLSLKKFVDIGASITNILDSVRGCLEAYQQNLKASALLKIAGAVAILAAALLVLSGIDSEKLAGSLASVAGLFAELMVSMSIIDKLNLDSRSLSKTGTAMIKMGAALLILSLAMKNIAELNPEQLAEGLIGVGMLLAEIAAFLKVAKFEKGATKTATGMVLFAAAIKILASAVKDLAALSWEDMAKGLVGVGVLLAEVDVFLNTAKFSGKSVLTATGIVLLAASIKILASACKDFGSMSWGEIIKGLTSIGVLLAEITAFTRLTGDAKHVIATGLALIEIGVAMKIFASAMKSFGDMSWESIVKGLIAMGGALAEVAIATNMMPKNMVGLGLGLIAVGAALEIITNVLSKMGNFSWEQIAKSLVTLGGALAELAIALNVMKGTLSGSAALLVASVALLALAPALKILGNMTWESIAKGLIAIAGAFAIFGVAGKLLTPVLPTIIGFSVALTMLMAALTGLIAIITASNLVGALTAPLYAIRDLFTPEILKAWVSLIPEFLIGIVNSLKGILLAVCETIVEGAPAIGEAIKALVLTLVDVLVECVPAIADGALQLVVGVLEFLVEYIPQIIDSLMQFLIEVLEGIARNLPQLIQAAMDVIGAFFSGVIDALKGINVDNLIKGLGALGLLTGIVAALGAITSLIPSAMAGVLGLGVIIAELAIVLAAIGALAQIPGLEWLISEGGHLLETIGTAIGGFVGGIVGGFMSGVSSSFPQIGADLAAFMMNVQPFIDGASSIDSSLLDGIANLTGAILLITAADLLEGLTSWLTGGSSLADFGEELVPFGESMVKFSNVMTDLDVDLVNKAAVAGKTLAEMAATLPNSGGIVDFFAGSNNMDEFGNQLVDFGKAMVLFGETVDGLKTDAVQNAAIAGKAMVELAATIPNTGGAVAFFTGDNDMKTFGEQLVPFGKAMKEYSDAVSGLEVDTIVNSATAGQALVELANTVPNTGGVLAFFTGDNDLATFGEQIVVFGKAMSDYSEVVANVKADVVANSATAGAALVELANTIPNTGGVVAFFTGDNDLATFGKQLVPFGEAMKDYSDTLDGFAPDAVTASAAAGQALVELARTVPNTGGLISFFTGDNDLAKFAAGLTPFGEAMKKYGESVSGLEQNSSAIEASVIAGQSLIELSKTLPNVGGVIDFFTGSNDLGTFAAGIKDFGVAMKQYGQTVSGLEEYSGSIEASVIAGDSLIALSKTLPNVGGVIEFFTGGNDLGTFATGIVSFGRSMKQYGAAVSGLEEYSGSIEASVIAGQSLIELSKTLPNVGGVIEFFTGNNDLGTFGSGIGSFGKAMKEYGEAVSGLEEYSGSIEASVVAGQSLVELAKTLPNTGGVVDFFIGNNDLGTFGSGISTFGKAMKDYGEAVSGLEEQTGAIEASVVAGQSLVELAKTLPNANGVVEFFTGKTDLATFGKQLAPFGKAIKEYSDAIADIKPDAINASTTAGQSLVELANTLPNCGGLVQVFTGSNSLASFGGEIVIFGRYLAAYAESIKDVKPEVVSASANAAKALSDLATGLPDSSLFDKWFGGDQTLASFGKDISAFGQEMNSYYSKIAGIKTETLSGVIREVWSIVDLAKGLQGLDTSGLSGFSNALKTMANNGIIEFIVVFSDSNSKVNAAVASMLINVSNSITGNKNLAITGMQDVMTALADVVIQKATEINSSVTVMMIGVSNMIHNNITPAQNAMKSVMEGALSAISGYYSQFYNVGANVGQGFVDGIGSKVSNATNAGYALGRAALTAAEKALDSHSPSREFMHLGENVGAGMAIGINNGIVPAAEASSDMIDEVLDVAGKGVNAFEDWLDEKKYYNEVSLKDELAGWEELQKQYIEGSEERKKIDREVYRVQNELVAETYQYSIDWIEREKYFNRLSTEEELEAYERMQKRYLEGSKERMAIDKKVYTLRNQLVDEAYQNEIDWLEEEEFYGRTTLVSKLAFYKKQQTEYAKGTEYRKKADREVYKLEQEIYEAQQQYIADVQAVQAEAAQKRLDLEEEYADKVTSINEKLASDIKSLNDQYENSLGSRTNSLYESYGLFDEVKEREEVSGEKLLDNLQGQVEEFSEWQRTLNSLSARGVDSELISELQQMGPSAISQIKALESMSDSELNRYVGLWSTKHALVREQAVSELDGLRVETQNSIAQLRVDAERELEEYRATWQQKMEQVDIDANAELEQLRKDFAEKVGLIEKDTTTELQEMVDASKKILEAAGWNETGQQIVNGITEGVKDKRQELLDEITDMALAVKEAYESTMEIESPSKVMYKLGRFTGQGLIDGLHTYADHAYSAGAEIADSTTAGLSGAIMNISDYLNGDWEAQPTIRPVMDLSDVASGMETIDGLFNNQRMLALAGQTSVAFAANAADNTMTVTVDNGGVVEELRYLRSEMAEMTERMARMQVVLDSGTLVGELAGPMDAALGQQTIYKGRGN